MKRLLKIEKASSSLEQQLEKDKDQVELLNSIKIDDAKSKSFTSQYIGALKEEYTENKFSDAEKERKKK